MPSESYSAGPDLDARFTERLGIPILTEVADHPVATEALSAQELAQLPHSVGQWRISSWLRGRNALKRLLIRLGWPSDTSIIQMPHRRLSISHSLDLSIALGSAHTGLRGIGVDMEITKPPRLDSAARFLSDGELKWLYLAPQCEQPIALLRLWTVKEAVFKALPDNAGVHFKDILLAAPGELDGEAFIGDGSHRVIVAYTTAPYQCGFISAAVNRPVT